jgi:hypothetical protein
MEGNATEEQRRHLSARSRGTAKMSIIKFSTTLISTLELGEAL